MQVDDNDAVPGPANKQDTSSSDKEDNTDSDQSMDWIIPDQSRDAPSFCMEDNFYTLDGCSVPLLRLHLLATLAADRPPVQPPLTPPESMHTSTSPSPPPIEGDRLNGAINDNDDNWIRIVHDDSDEEWRQANEAARRRLLYETDEEEEEEEVEERQGEAVDEGDEFRYDSPINYNSNSDDDIENMLLLVSETSSDTGKI